MTECHRKPVLAGLRKNRRKTVAREVLEFIHKKGKVLAFLLRDGGSSHGRQLKHRDQDGAEQVRFVLAETAFGEVGDEYPLVVHHEAGINPAAYLAQDVAYRRGDQELPDLVLYRSNGFLP